MTEDLALRHSIQLEKMAKEIKQIKKRLNKLEIYLEDKILSDNFGKEKCSRVWFILDGRVWFILDGIYWLAGFDGKRRGHIYKIENGKIEEVRSSNPLWKKLWDRVRNEEVCL